MQLTYLTVAVFASQALAGPKPKIAPRQAPSSPCAAVSASASAALAAAPSGTYSPTHLIRTEARLLMASSSCSHHLGTAGL